jgi:hypothetical protein
MSESWSDDDFGGGREPGKGLAKNPGSDWDLPPPSKDKREFVKEIAR